MVPKQQPLLMALVITALLLSISSAENRNKPRNLRRRNLPSSSSDCSDDPSFVYTGTLKTGKKDKSHHPTKDCHWIAQSLGHKKRQKACDSTHGDDDITVRESCPVACGVCEPSMPTNAPTNAPTDSPTNSPTDSASPSAMASESPSASPLVLSLAPCLRFRSTLESGIEESCQMCPGDPLVEPDLIEGVVTYPQTECTKALKNFQCYYAYIEGQETQNIWAPQKICGLDSPPDLKTLSLGTRVGPQPVYFLDYDPTSGENCYSVVDRSNEDMFGIWTTHICNQQIPNERHSSVRIFELEYERYANLHNQVSWFPVPSITEVDPAPCLTFNSTLESGVEKLCQMCPEDPVEKCDDVLENIYCYHVLVEGTVKRHPKAVCGLDSPPDPNTWDRDGYVLDSDPASWENCYTIESYSRPEIPQPDFTWHMCNQEIPDELAGSSDRIVRTDKWLYGRREYGFGGINFWP